jgi:GntR family transcriptional repressor for pyruvate dehydrogenase complex
LQDGVVLGLHFDSKVDASGFVGPRHLRGPVQKLAQVLQRLDQKRVARRRDFAAEVQTEHQAILQAVQAGDAAAARQAAATHMGNAITRIRSADPAFWQQEGERLAQPLVKGLRA